MSASLRFGAGAIAVGLSCLPLALLAQQIGTRNTPPGGVQQQAQPADVPSEMITTSGAGLDPHIPPSAAMLQTRRVAAARGVSVDRIEELLGSATEPPLWGFLGRSRVNVLKLNLALDEALGAPATPASVSR